MATITITNVSNGRLSLDIPVPSGGIGEDHPKAIRANLGRGQSIDVGDIVTIDDLNRTIEFQELLATGLITVVVAAEPADLDIPGAGLGAHAANHVTGGPDPLTVSTDAAINAASFMGYHETLLAVEAPGTLKGAIDELVPLAPPLAQPSHPVTLDVAFPLGWEGGDVIVTGVVNGIGGTSEVFVAAPGVIVPGILPFATIASINNTAPGGGGGDSATVLTGLMLGLSARGDAGSYGVYKLSVNAVDEAPVATDPIQGTFQPTTAPNGINNYEVWYTANHGHGQFAHTHTLA